MDKLTRSDLFTLETYSERRPAFRARVLEHKHHRQVALGEHARLYFEDRLTIQYQIQEMLRVERIFEPGGIEDELGAYNPLIPDGHNLKATFMIEFEDAEERREALSKMTGIEDRIWLRVGDNDRIWAIADEDLERSNDKKTSSVHFLRFELDSDSIAGFKGGSTVVMGVDHDAYRHQVSLSDRTQSALAADLS